MPGIFDGNFGDIQGGGSAFPGVQRPAWGGANPGWASGLQGFMRGGQPDGMRMRPGADAPGPGGAYGGDAPPPGGGVVGPGMQMPIGIGADAAPPPGGGYGAPAPPQVGTAMMQPPGGSGVMAPGGAVGPTTIGLLPNPGGVPNTGRPPIAPGGGVASPGVQVPMGIGAGGGFAGGLRPYMGQAGNGLRMRPHIDI